MKKGMENRNEDTDQVASLIRMAGRRPPVPDDATLRVREAVRNRWRQELRKRSLRRRVLAAAILTAAGLLVVPLGPHLLRLARPTARMEPVARVAAIVHPVWARDSRAPEAGEPAAFRLGDPITPGTTITTEGKGAIAIRMGSGHSVRLDTATRVRVLSASLLELIEGGVYVDSGGHSATAGNSLGIRTRLGTVRDIGTQYLLRASDEGVRIRVREGTVLMNGGEAGNQRVEVGSELAMNPDGSTSISQVPIYGPEWDWAERTASMMDLEGKSLSEFLDWVSRERGYSLSYADSETERSASTIVLSGSIQGLSLHEAVDAVLPTCGMTSQIVAGELRIATLREGGA